MKKIIVLILITIAAGLNANAQIGKVAAMKGKVTNGYDFWLYAPQQYFERTNDKFPALTDR